MIQASRGVQPVSFQNTMKKILPHALRGRPYLILRLATIINISVGTSFQKCPVNVEPISKQEVGLVYKTTNPTSVIYNRRVRCG